MHNYILPEAASLGDPVAEFRRPFWGVTILMLALIGFFGFGAWWGWRQTPIDMKAVIAFSGFSVFFLGLYCYSFYRAFSRVQLFEHGLIASRMSGVEIVRWDAIEAVRLDSSTVHGIAALGIRIRLQSGKTINLSGLPNDTPRSTPTPGLAPQIGLPDLVRCVIEASYPHRAATAIAQYEARARVDFKTVQISREGIHVKNRTLPWPSVADIDTDGAIMLIKQTGQSQPWGVVKVIQIPNEDILPVLIGHTQSTRYAAFQDDESIEVAAIQRRRLWRHRLLWWGLPLLIVALPLAISYGQYVISGESARWSGEKAFYRGDYQEALSAFDLALQRAPNDALYYVNRGRAERELKLYEQALKDFATALRLQPNYPYALLNRGRLYHRQGDYDLAIADYTRAIANRPNYDSAFCSRGVSYEKRGSNDLAIADFKTCYEVTQDQGWRELAIKELQKLGVQR